LALLASAAFAPRPAFAQSPAALRVTTAIDDGATPFLYAIDSGLFRKNGLDGSIERATSGAAAASAVMGGTFEAGKASIISFLSAHAHGLPLVAVAAAAEYDASRPNLALAVRPDSPIRTGADLNGKIVAVSAINDLYTIGTRAWADAHGGDSSTIKFVELPISAVAAALDAGRIDAGGTIDPDLQEALATGKVRVLCDPNGAIAPRFMYTGWMSTLDYARTNRATCDKFRAALLESARYVNGHMPETVDVMSKFTSIPASVFASMPRIQSALTVDVKLLQPLIDTCAKYKAIPNSFDAHDLIDPALR
jgi:NitT/TauT family transport system substrate-binding protein